MRASYGGGMSGRRAAGWSIPWRLLAASLLAASLLAAAATARAGPAAHPALWKVADADTTIYLFGTIHVLPAGVDWLDGPVAKAFDGADTLVTEVVAGDPAAMQALVARYATLPPGETLRGQLGAGERAALEAALARIGVPPAAFDRFRPWFAAVNLALLPVLGWGFAIDNGPEAVLAARAEAQAKPHAALETAEYQLALFAALPPVVERGYLAETERELPDLRGEIAAMLAAWQRGDAETLAALVNAGEDDPAMVKALITDRNRAWAGWIAHRLDTPGTVFVAVGAGHLAGPHRVQAQLAARGITVARVQ